MNRETALIWMSAGNSYFDKKNISKLINFADENFDKVIITSPDKPAEHTFKALGYTEDKAAKKARLNANLLKNRVKKQLANTNSRDKFLVIDWSGEISNNEEFNKRYAEIDNLYKNNSKFREDARNMTNRVIKDKNNNPLKIEEMVDKAVFYLLEELAFVLSCPKMYNSEKVTYLYHHKWEIYQNLISGKYDGKLRDNLAFLLTKL